MRGLHGFFLALRCSASHYMDACMDKAVSAVEANRRFSQLLRSVRDGDSYVVTSHGRPVARIIPVKAGAKGMTEARRQLFARLRSEPAIEAGGWTRDELYER